MKKPNCKEILNILDEYLDGELSPDERREVRTHVESCPSCKKEYDELCTIRALLEATQENAPSSLSDRVMTAVRTQEVSDKKYRPTTRRIASIALVATLALAVLTSPMIITLSLGGSSASDAENFFTQDNSNVKQDADIVQPSHDDIDKENSGTGEEVTDDPLIFGKEYTVYTTDGDLSVIKFEENAAYFNDKTFEYELSESKVVLTSSTQEITLNFILSESNKIVSFKEVENTHD